MSVDATKSLTRSVQVQQETVAHLDTVIADLLTLYPEILLEYGERSEVEENLIILDTYTMHIHAEDIRAVPPRPTAA